MFALGEMAFPHVFDVLFYLCVYTAGLHFTDLESYSLNFHALFSMVGRFKNSHFLSSMRNA